MLDVDQITFSGGIPLKVKIVKQGGSFGFRVPKTLVDTGILQQGKEYSVTVSMEEKTKVNKKPKEAATVPPEANQIEFSAPLIHHHWINEIYKTPLVNSNFPL